MHFWTGELAVAPAELPCVPPFACPAGLGLTAAAEAKAVDIGSSVGAADVAPIGSGE